MEALIALASLVVLALLAARFGHDSRPGLRTKEQDWAAQGITWGDEPPPSASRTDRLARQRDSIQHAGTALTDYPVLALIDRALGAAGPGFARAADAARLERLARDVADEYWGQTVWLTGRVPGAALRVVCDLLERERVATPEAAKSAETAGTAARTPVPAGGLGPLDQVDRREGSAQPRPLAVAAAVLPPHAFGRDRPRSEQPQAAQGLTRAEPPMRLSLLNLSPDEYAALAAQLGPDGAARVAAGRPTRMLARSRGARAVAPSAAAGETRADDGMPDRRPDRAKIAVAS